MAVSKYTVKDVLAMFVEECKTVLTELGLEVKEVKRDDLQVMFIYIIIIK